MRNGLKAALLAGAVTAFGVTGFAYTAQASNSDGYYQHHMGHGKHHRYHGKKHHRKHARKHRRHHSYQGHGFKRMMERFDANTDNELSQDELNTARKNLLAKHDGDKNGDLTLEEFQALWLEFMHKQMVRSFQHLDQDGDASVTVEEFLEPFSEAVAHMDRNGDGVLNGKDRRHRNRHGNSTDETQEDQ